MARKVWVPWLRRGLLGAAILVVGVLGLDMSAGAFLRDRLDARGLGETVTFGSAQPRLSLDGATLNLADLSVTGGGAGLAADSLMIAGVDPLQPDPMGGISLELSRPALSLGGLALPEWATALGGGMPVDGTLAVDWLHEPDTQSAVLTVNLDAQETGRLSLELGVSGVSRAMLEAGAAAAAALAGGEPPSAESLAALMPLVSSLALTHLGLAAHDAGALRSYLDRALGEGGRDALSAQLADLAQGDGDGNEAASAIIAFLDGTTDRLVLRTTQDQPIAVLERRGLFNWGPAPILSDPAAFIMATEMEEGAD